MRQVVLLSLIAGVLAGIIGAIAIPKTRDSLADTATPSAIGSVGKRGAPRIAMPRPLRKALRTRTYSDERLLLRVKDPDGEPDWAVRTFRSQPGACAQLGRIVNGRFGWIDAANLFRPARRLPGDAPMQCGVKRRFPQSDMAATETTTYGVRPDGSYAARRIVLWGRTTPGPVRINLHRAHRTTRTTADGAWLTFIDEAHTGQTVVRTADGHRHYIDTMASDPAFRAQQQRFRDRAPQLLPARVRRAMVPRTIAQPARVAARTPDPDGGPALGLASARATDGSVCIGYTGQVVGNRVGRVLRSLGTFAAYHDSFRVCDSNFAPRNSPPPSRKHPYRMMSAYGAPGDTHGGRSARRTVPGRVLLTGYTAPDVRTLTIKSPRDVRTIVPSRRDHTFIVVYDGTFVTGTFKITTTFTDGTTHEQTLPAAM